MAERIEKTNHEAIITHVDDVNANVHVGLDAQSGMYGAYTIECLPGDLAWYQQRIGKRVRISQVVEVLEDPTCKT